MCRKNELIHCLISSFHFIVFCEITVISKILSDLSHDTVQTAEAALFKGFHVKAGIFSQLLNLISAVNADIALACEMNQRHFDMIANPALHR